MDYTQRMPTMEEVVVKALRAHDKRDCDACPYEYGYQPCRDLFEAKSTTGDRIQRCALTQEQIDVLQRHHELGAIAFVAVELDMHMFTVPWPIWRDMRTWFGRKYITRNELKMFEVQYGYSRGVLFLGRVDRMQDLRENNIWRE